MSEIEKDIDRTLEVMENIDIMFSELINESELVKNTPYLNEMSVTLKTNISNFNIQLKEKHQLNELNQRVTYHKNKSR